MKLQKPIAILTIFSVIAFYLSWNIDEWFEANDMAYVVDMLLLTSIILAGAIVVLFAVTLKKAGVANTLILSVLWGSGIVGTVAVKFIQRLVSNPDKGSVPLS